MGVIDEDSRQPSDMRSYPRTSPGAPRLSSGQGWASLRGTRVARPGRRRRGAARAGVGPRVAPGGARRGLMRGGGMVLLSAYNTFAVALLAEARTHARASAAGSHGR
jgi:hypothetical protein